MSKFKLPPAVKPRVNEGALAAFSAGADARSTEQGIERPETGDGGEALAAPVRAQSAEKATESFLLRLTPSQMRLLTLVFEQTNVKSRQKLVEGILIPELERRAANLRSKAA